MGCNLIVERNIYSRILYFWYLLNWVINNSFIKYINLGSLCVLINGDSEYVAYIFR